MDQLELKVTQLRLFIYSTFRTRTFEMNRNLAVVVYEIGYLI